LFKASFIAIENLLINVEFVDVTRAACFCASIRTNAPSGVLGSILEASENIAAARDFASVPVNFSPFAIVEEMIFAPSKKAF
jgi:S-adenosylmethionine synthetase